MMIRKPLVALAALTLLAGCGKGGGEAAQTPAAGAGAATAPQTPVTLDMPAGVYKNDPLHSSLLWSVPHFGMSKYVAKFTKYDAEVTLDPADITKSQVKLTIDPRSVRTDYPTESYKKIHGDRPFKGWDDELGTGDRWFNAGKFPTITFTSTKVERTGPRTARVTGDLNFLGMSKPAVMDVTLGGQRLASGARPPRFGVHAEGVFDRTTYGMKVGAAGAPVTITFDGEFTTPGGAGD